MMPNRKLATLLLVLCLLLTLGTALCESESDNLLENGSFEQLDAAGLPVGWYTDAYTKQEGYTTFSVSDEAHDGDHAAVVNNLGMNDARFAQTVAVEPESLYCLSGWIKADVLDSGRGANLSVEGLYVFSESVFSTDGGWQYIEFYGETGTEQTEVTVFARVGGYSGESQGVASFDGLSLCKADAVPGDSVAALWFSMDTSVDNSSAVIDGTEEEAAPFWPWLLALAAVYGLLAMWAVSTLTVERHELSESKHAPAFLIVGLIAATVARLLTALLVQGYQVDVTCFRSWGATMSQVGATGFYPATDFCDYPPAYVYILGLNQTIAHWLTDAVGSGFQTWFGTLGLGTFSDVISVFVMKLVPIACDTVASYLIYRFARKQGMDRLKSGLLGLLTALNPAFFLNSAAWCQMDSVLCLGLMLVAWLAIERKWMAVLPVYVFCVLIKPQALMLGFLGLTAIVLDWIRHKEDRKPMLIGVGISAVAAAAVLIPFSIHQDWNWLITLYGKTLSSYPYATVNTANLYYLFDANWVAIESQAGWLAPAVFAAACAGWACCVFLRQKKMKLGWLEPALMAAFAVAFAVMAVMNVSWGVVGFAAMALAFALVLPMYIRGGQLKHLPLLGGILFLLLYVLGVKMHERYLFPALLFLTMAFVVTRDRRVFLLLVVSSLTMFVNEGIVLDNSIRLGSSMGHLNRDTQWLNVALSVMNVLCVPLAVWMGQRVCVEGAESAPDQTLRPVFPCGHRQQLPCRVTDYKTDAGLHWQRLDWVLMLSVTLIYAVVALWNLGSTKAPQQPWKSTALNESVTLDLGDTYADFRMLYFAQVSYENFTVAYSEDGTSWSEEYWAEMAQGQCYRWKYVTEYTAAGASITFNSVPREMSGRYVRITAQQIGLVLDEVIFRTPDGTLLPATVAAHANANEDSPLLSDPSALLDEQDTLDGEPSWYNSTYFDEIYHARTAYEQLHGTTVYEWTHPPLGKLLMSLGVAIFGMIPFGWRFAGALMGILMLPVMYLLGKQLTKRTGMAFTAMTLLALDCMHLTQTRIATIDSFPVFFIMLSWLFMLRFMQRDIALAPMKKVLPDLALSGLFMGCGIASKWIGAYAAIGLALLYFWTCARHLRLSREVSRLLAEDTENTMEDGLRAELSARAKDTLPRILHLCLWCLLFFVAVPVAIYLLSYIPHMMAEHATGLVDYVRRVIAVQVNMLNYHSTPRLGMDHPYYSPWYEWPLLKRPMWYASASYVPEGYSYSIFCFGNPAVWLTGLAGMAATAFVWLRRHQYVLEGSDSVLHARSTRWSVAPAFVLIGLLAQFLPWVLVPRGTYIYHYFASVPFLILGTMLMLHWLCQRCPKAGHIVTYSYLALCLVFFIGFYPYASGMLTPTWWLDFMKQFLRIYY